MPDQPALIAVLTDEYFDYRKLFIDQIACMAADAGYGTLCIAGRDLLSTSSTTPYDSRAISNSIYSLIDRYPLSGLISLSGAVGYSVSKSQLHTFLNQFSTIPTVSLGIELPDIASVIFEDAGTMTRLMEHVMENPERKRFAFVRGFAEDPYSLERESIFRNTLHARGHQVEEALFVTGNYDPFDTFNAVNQLLAEHRNIDVIVAANDLMALSAARAINSQGLRIPDDIVVTGFDDTSHATQAAPALTTVRQPIIEGAKLSARLLLDQIERACNTTSVPVPENHEVVSVASELIIRGSTTRHHQHDGLNKALDLDTLESQFKIGLAGLPMPEQIDMDVVTRSLWQTLMHGTQDLEHCLESLLPYIQPGNTFHWWSNLCHQIEVNAASSLNRPALIKTRPLINSALAKVRERVWVASMDREFDLRRQQNIRMKMQLQMSSCKDMPKILETMSRWLSLIEATRCFLIRYESPGLQPSPKAELIHVVRNQQVETCSSIVFDSHEVLPHPFVNELCHGILIQNPVYAGDRLFGYLLLDPTGIDLLYIDSAAQSIGNAMRNHFLISQLEQQAAHLETANEELVQLATHDELTGLANRLQFHKHLRACCEQASSEDSQVSVYFIDLDGFKLVNDTLGHGAGDQLLKLVATRLKQAVQIEAGDRGMVARLGGDEFTVVVQQPTNEQGPDKLAEALLKTLSTVSKVQGQDINLSGSIGTASFPADAQDVQTLVKHADIAMYRAKANGKHCVVAYSEELNVVNDTFLQMDSDMRVALNTGDICMHYQPRIDLQSGEICAVEALMRWTMDSPEGRQIRTRPDVFIPIAEITGFITQLDTFALDDSCRQARQWQQEGLPLMVAVNVSVLQLQQENFLDTLKTVLKKHDLDPALLELEITESGVMTDVQKNAHTLEEIRQLGIQLSVDDFGTGYSSLNYLKQLPVNNLKIDRSFIIDIDSSDGGDSVDASIVRSIVALGKIMGYQLIAEGIETEAQHEFVKSLGCDQAQGYLFAKPQAAGEITKLMQSEKLRKKAA